MGAVDVVALAAVVAVALIAAAAVVAIVVSVAVSSQVAANPENRHAVCTGFYNTLCTSSAFRIGMAVVSRRYMRVGGRGGAPPLFYMRYQAIAMFLQDPGCTIVDRNERLATLAFVILSIHKYLNLCS